MIGFPQTRQCVKEFALEFVCLVWRRNSYHRALTAIRAANLYVFQQSVNSRSVALGSAVWQKIRHKATFRSHRDILAWNIMRDSVRIVERPILSTSYWGTSSAEPKSAERPALICGSVCQASLLCLRLLQTKEVDAAQTVAGDKFAAVNKFRTQRKCIAGERHQCRSAFDVPNFQRGVTRGGRSQPSVPTHTVPLTAPEWPSSVRDSRPLPLPIPSA